MKFEDYEELLEKVLDLVPNVPTLSKKLILDEFKKEVKARKNFEEDSDNEDYTFELENSTVNIETVGNLHLHNRGDLIVNQNNKLEQIQENLLKLAKKGIQFTRQSTYHVKVLMGNEYWNVYLSGKEKWMRDGLPEEGRGLDRFISKWDSIENKP